MRGALGATAPTFVATRSRSTSPADPNSRRGRSAGAASRARLGAPTGGGRRLAPGAVAARVHIAAPRPGPRHAVHPAFKGKLCSVAALPLPSDSPRQHGSPPLMGSHAYPPFSLFPLFPRFRGPSSLDGGRRWRPCTKDRPRTGVKLFWARIGAGGCGGMAEGGVAPQDDSDNASRVVVLQALPTSRELLHGCAIRWEPARKHQVLPSLCWWPSPLRRPPPSAQTLPSPVAQGSAADAPRAHVAPTTGACAHGVPDLGHHIVVRVRRAKVRPVRGAQRVL